MIIVAFEASNLEFKDFEVLPEVELKFSGDNLFIVVGNMVVTALDSEVGNSK